MFFYFVLEGVEMKIADRLSKEQKLQLGKSPKKKRKPEKLSTEDIKHLMGMDRQTYTRKNGAIRNK
jgi:hypothetical protein